jgi:hypothetical protein
MSFLLSLKFKFPLQQNRGRRGQHKFCLEVVWGLGECGTMYTQVTKCKNDKIKGERKKEREHIVYM